MIIKRKKKYSIEEVVWGYILIFPTLIGLIILNLWPAVQSIIMSFQKSSGFGKTTWTGLENYKRLIVDADVWQASINTVKYTIIVVPLIMILSLIVASLLNQKVRWISFYRTLFFLPVVAAPTAVAMVWRWIFNSEYGLINGLLEKINVAGPSWLTDPNIALFSICIVGIWSAVGYNMVIILAGLQEIPRDYYESAEIDGASPVRKFFSITVPLVSPTLFFVSVTTMISSLQVFDLIYMMINVNGTAIKKTQSLVYLFYKHSFVLNNKGYGSAIVLVLLVIIILVTIIQLYFQKKWVHYN